MLKIDVSQDPSPALKAYSLHAFACFCKPFYSVSGCFRLRLGWQHALMLFRTASTKRVLPDPACCGLLIAECEQRGLQSLEPEPFMRSLGISRDFEGFLRDFKGLQGITGS